jgi:hypothetical protein
MGGDSKVYHIIVMFVQLFYNHFTLVLNLVCRITELSALKKRRDFGPLANYADRVTAACWRSSANFCGYRALRGQCNGPPGR